MAKTDVGDKAAILELEVGKTAEDGTGTTIHHPDIGGSEQTVTVQSPLVQLKKAVQTDLVERDQQPVPLLYVHSFTIPVQSHETVAIRINRHYCSVSSFVGVC